MKIPWRRGLALFLAFLVVFFVAVWFARGLVYQHVALPLAQAGWLLGNMLRTVPDHVYLGLLAGVGLAFVLYAMLDLNNSETRPERRVAPEGDASRYAFWLRAYEHLETSRFSRELAANDMRRLLYAALAEHAGLSVSEARARVQSGELALPEEVLEFLNDRSFVEPDARGWRERWFSRRDGAPTPGSALERQFELVLETLETTLEVQHDDDTIEPGR